MRRICLVLSLLLAATVPARAQLRFSESTIDLGEVRAGAPASCRFRFENVGTTSIELVDLERSCGCMQPVWHEKRLEPGQAGTIEMNFRTLGQPEGRRTWNATLLQRVGSEIRRQPLIVTATIRNEITIEPSQAAITVTTKVMVPLLLVDHRARPLKIVDVTTKAAGVRIATVTIGPDKTAIRLFVDASGMAPGQHDEVLAIRTDDPAYPLLEVPLTVTRPETPAVTWSPEWTAIVLAPGQKQASALVQIRSEKPLVVRSITASEPGMTCTWAAGDEGTTVRIRVDRETFRSRALLPYVHVNTDGPMIDIPVEVRLE
jgi:Protein of unknown function (DUF1573)